MVLKYNYNAFVNALINYNRMKDSCSESGYMYDKYKVHLKDVLFASASKIGQRNYQLESLRILLDECITSGYISIALPSVEETVVEVFSGTSNYSIGHLLINSYIEKELKKIGWNGYVTPFGLNRSWIFEDYALTLFDHKLPTLYSFEQFIFEKETLKGFVNDYYCINLDIKYNPNIFYIFDEYTKKYKVRPDFKTHHTNKVYDDNYKYNNVESPFLGYAEKNEFYTRRKNFYSQVLNDRLEGLPEKYERAVKCFGESHAYTLSLKRDLEKGNCLLTILLIQY